MRYETRPEVRKESSALFEAKRKADAEDARIKAEVAKVEAARKRDAYLESAAKMRSHVESIHQRAAEAREKLVVGRRQDAQHVRHHLEEARQHKLADVTARHEEAKALHDEVKTWKEESFSAQSNWWWW